MLQDNDTLVTDPETPGPLKQMPTKTWTDQDKRIQIHPLVFLLNWCMLTSIPGFVVFFLFYDVQGLRTKGKVGIFLICWSTSVMTIAILHLKISLRNVLKTLIILDEMTLTYFANSLVFVGLMHFLDDGKWEYKVLEVAFCIGACIKVLNLRLLLLFMKWKPIYTVSYKIGLYIHGLTYFSIGLYTTYTNYTFSYSMLPDLDLKIRFFIVLFGFASFEYMSKLVKLMTSFDFSEAFHSSYVIKDVQEDTEFERECLIREYGWKIKQERLLKKQKQREVEHMIPVIKEKPAKKQMAPRISKMASKGEEPTNQAMDHETPNESTFRAKSQGKRRLRVMMG